MPAQPAPAHLRGLFHHTIKFPQPLQVSKVMFLFSRHALPGMSARPPFSVKSGIYISKVWEVGRSCRHRQAAYAGQVPLPFPSSSILRHQQEALSCPGSWHTVPPYVSPEPFFHHVFLPTKGGKSPCPALGRLGGSPGKRSSPASSAFLLWKEGEGGHRSLPCGRGEAHQPALLSLGSVRCLKLPGTRELGWDAWHKGRAWELGRPGQPRPGKREVPVSHWWEGRACKTASQGGRGIAGPVLLPASSRHIMEDRGKARDSTSHVSHSAPRKGSPPPRQQKGSQPSQPRKAAGPPWELG